jgi:Arc/MetJ-type ribon-helix-helix transcriptional regulator
MKGRISITLDEDAIEFLKELVKRDNYRNMSHLVETLIKIAWANDKGKSKIQGRLK